MRATSVEPDVCESPSPLQPSERLISTDQSRAAADGQEGVGSDLTVCLATINERENLPPLFSEIERFCGSGLDIIVVDDGSSDGTREFLERTAQSNSHIRYVFNEAPQTIVGAHVQGITMARTPYIIMMDSDLQHPPDAIPRMLASLREGHDVVVATRHGKGGSTGPRSAFRGLVSRVAAVLIQTFIRNTRRLSDPTSGFFGVRREALKPFATDLRGYETLIFVLAMMERPRVSEVPYVFRARGNGQSKVLRGWSFFQVFFVQLVAAKRTELKARKKHSGILQSTPSAIR
jgi:dolichol-phosphate mannosyltransferase